MKIIMGKTLNSLSKPYGSNSTDRRSKPRIYEDFVAKVRGVGATRQRFVEHTIVENLSSSGLYMRLGQDVVPESRLLIVLRLLFPNSEQDSVLLIAFSGVVLRSEPHPDDAFGVAIRFSRYRFLSTHRSEGFFEDLIFKIDALPI